MKRKLILFLAVNLIIGSMVQAASWSGKCEVDIPGHGDIEYGKDNNVSNKLKTEQTSEVSFDIDENTAWSNSRIAMVSTHNEMKSKYAFTSNGVHHPHTVDSPQTNEYFNVKLVSDWKQMGTDTVIFKWSPDIIN